MKRDMTIRSLLGAALLLAGGASQPAWAEAAGNTGNAARLPAGLELLDGPLLNPSPWEPEARSCDPSPKTTTAEACGKAYPATTHLAWSNCKPQPPGGRPPPPPPGDGTQPPPPPPGDGTWPPPPAFGEAPPPPPGGHGGGPRGMPPDVTSTGTVDMTATLAPVNACSEGAPMQLSRKATYDVTRTHGDGKVMRVTGSAASTEVNTPNETAHRRTTTLDTTHTFTAADGTVERSIHLTGTLEETHSRTNGPPTVTLKGTLNADTSERGKEVVTLTDLVRAPPHECAWPVSGTMDRTAADGTHHVLKFGPTCGSATLDGAAITLPAHHGPPGPGGRGPGPGGQQPGTNPGSTR